MTNLMRLPRSLRSLAMGIKVTKCWYNHIFTLTCWKHKILKLTQITGLSMNDLKTFLPQMLKMFNFCIKKSLYDANLNINTIMANTTFWVLCPQWQYDNIVDLINQTPIEKKKDAICFFFRKKYPHFLLFHLWNHTSVAYIMS